MQISKDDWSIRREDGSVIPVGEVHDGAGNGAFVPSVLDEA
jgi:hypothetical protein